MEGGKEKCRIEQTLTGRHRQGEPSGLVVHNTTNSPFAVVDGRGRRKREGRGRGEGEMQCKNK